MYAPKDAMRIIQNYFGYEIIPKNNLSHFSYYTKTGLITKTGSLYKGRNTYTEKDEKFRMYRAKSLTCMKDSQNHPALCERESKSFSVIPAIRRL